MKMLVEKDIRKILKAPIYCDIAEKTLTRRHDDTDGSRDLKHTLTLAQGPDGDMYIGVGSSMWLRFRTWNGGGRSLNTHNALRILAEAIKMDSETNPD